MRHTYLTLLCWLTLTIGLAQQSSSNWILKGQLVDSISRAPIQFATLVLKTEAGAATVKGVISEADGSFVLPDLKEKKYRLSVSLLGYQNKELIVSNSSTDLGVISLSSSATNLQEISITASKSLIRQEIDRINYDVQADPESKAQTALEMLRKVPLLSIDGDDNIQLQGSSSYRVFINGKPSALMATNAKDALRAMPAGSIQRVEVITTPPAKYDSEGLAGIINIVLNKKVGDGYNANLSSRYNFPFGPSFNLSGTAKQAKWGFSGSLSRNLNNETTIQTQNFRQTYNPASLFAQNGSATSQGNSWFGSAELSFELDSLNLFTASGNGSNSHFYQTDLRQTQFSSSSPAIVPQAYLLRGDNEFPWQATDFSLNYQRGFKDNAQHLLTFSYRFSHWLSRQATETVALEKLNYKFPDNKQWSNAGAKEHTYQVDYVHPFKKITLEAGAKAILRQNSSITSAENLILMENELSYVLDPTRVNDFDYQQDVLSLYNSYSWKSGEVAVKAGIRAEQTLVDAHFKTTETGVARTYTNFTPSISVMHNLKNKQSLTLGLSSRVERPGINLLNPFVDKSNPQLIATGNPDLKAVQSYQAELSYVKNGKGSLNLRTSYQFTSGGISGVVSILSDTLSQTRYENIGKNSILRLGINGNYPLGKLSLNFNTGAFYVWISGPYNGQFYRNHGIRTNSFANLSYRPGKDWTLGFNAGFNRRYITLQGSSDDFYYSSFSAVKTFLDKKLSVTAIISNPNKKFNSFTQYAQSPDFYQSTTRNSYYRTFTLAASYKFGKLSTNIKKNKRGISNDDVTN